VTDEVAAKVLEHLSAMREHIRAMRAETASLNRLPADALASRGIEPGSLPWSNNGRQGLPH